ncbi:MAG: hypothetical protein AAGB46_13810 [Verrucomicrobiota bacterium]
MTELINSYAAPRLSLMAVFLASFAASRLLSRSAYRKLSKETLYQLKLEFGRFGRVFLFFFAFLVFEVAYLYFNFISPIRNQIIIETVVTTLAIALGLSQAITIHIQRKPILSRAERRSFGLSNLIGIFSLICLSILILTFWS